MRGIKSHYSKSHFRFMEMFVETIADSFADSHFLRVIFLWNMHPAQRKNLDKAQNMLEWNLAVPSVQVSDMATRECSAHEADTQLASLMSQMLG